jgi:hypothetical protein
MKCREADDVLRNPERVSFEVSAGGVHYSREEPVFSKRFTSGFASQKLKQTNIGRILGLQ